MKCEYGKLENSRNTLDPIFFNSGEVLWMHPCPPLAVSPLLEDERLRLPPSSLCSVETGLLCVHSFSACYSTAAGSCTEVSHGDRHDAAVKTNIAASKVTGRGSGDCSFEFVC